MATGGFKGGRQRPGKFQTGTGANIEDSEKPRGQRDQTFPKAFETHSVTPAKHLHLSFSVTLWTITDTHTYTHRQTGLSAFFLYKKIKQKRWNLTGKKTAALTPEAKSCCKCVNATFWRLSPPKCTSFIVHSAHWKTGLTQVHRSVGLAINNPRVRASARAHTGRGRGRLGGEGRFRSETQNPDFWPGGLNQGQGCGQSSVQLDTAGRYIPQGRGRGIFSSLSLSEPLRAQCICG